MNLKTVKKDSEIVLTGINVDVERQDDLVTAVCLHDRDGNCVAIRIGQYGSTLAILVEDKTTPSATK